MPIPVTEDGFVGQVEDGIYGVGSEEAVQDPQRVFALKHPNVPVRVHPAGRKLLAAPGEQRGNDLVTSRCDLVQGRSDHGRVVLAVHDR